MTLPTELCLGNLTEFNHRILIACAKSGFDITSLGMVCRDPLWFISPKRIKREVPNILVTGTFHGEEPAGCLGILEFLESNPEKIVEGVNLSFLPLVNPTGFALGTRFNYWGDSPNSGFVESVGDKLSLEGKIILDNFDVLKRRARDGFISLHEDEDYSDFYVYSFERGDKPDSFTRMILDTGSRYFTLAKATCIDGAPVSDSCIFNYGDGTFEHRLFEEGIPYTAATETPGRESLRIRIQANKALIEDFCEFSAKNA